MGGEVGGELLELLVGELDVVAEVHIAFALQRHQVDMRVRHFQSQHGHPHLGAGADLLDALGHAASKALQLGVEPLVQVKQVIDLFLGNAEHMALDHGVDV